LEGLLNEIKKVSNSFDFNSYCTIELWKILITYSIYNFNIITYFFSAFAVNIVTKLLNHTLFVEMVVSTRNYSLRTKATIEELLKEKKIAYYKEELCSPQRKKVVLHIGDDAIVEDDVAYTFSREGEELIESLIEK
jgi:hypothetical protein